MIAGATGNGEDAMAAARVTVIMPVHEGARTLARSVESVLAQSVTDWELVIVIDGGSDGSEAIARAAADADPRIGVVRQDQSGPAAARNTGLSRARSPWIVFLDDDDTLSKEFLARMLGGTLDGLDVRVTGFTRLNESGQEIGRQAPPDIVDDPVACCLSGPPAAIHCFLARRSAVERVGGFDASLRIGEDWDLWLRMAQDGARFDVVAGHLAQYRSEGQSLTADGEAMLRDFNRVLDKAVSSGAAGYFDAQAAADQLLASLFWSAGNAIGRGESAVALAATVDPRADWRLQVAGLATRFIDGLTVGSRRPWTEQIFSMHLYRPLLDELFEELGRRLEGAFDPFAIRQAIEGEMLRAGHYGRPIRLEHAAGLPIRLRRLRAGWAEQPFPDLLLLRLPRLRPTPVFTFSMPMLTPLTGGDLVRQMLRSTWRRIEARLDRSDRLFQPFARLRRGWRMGLRVVGRADRRSFLKAPVALAALRAEIEAATRGSEAVVGLPQSAPPRVAPEHPATGATQAEWEAFFAAEDPWDYGNAYEQVKYDRTLELITGDGASRPAHALEIACAEGRFTEQLAPWCDRLSAIDISQTALDRAARRAARFSHIDYAQRDIFREGVEGSYDLITCSEVLYYLPDREAVAKLAGEVAASLKPGGRFVHAHAYQLVDSPGRTAFDWDDSFGAQSIFEAFRAAPGLVHRRTIDSDCYRIDLFEKCEAVAEPRIEQRPLGAELTDRVASALVWNGAVRTRSAVRDQRTFRLPVLRYPRIVAGNGGAGSDGLDREQFARQLRFLRRRGFHTPSLGEWDQGARLGGSLKGRPVLFTFDYADEGFAEHAWPLLKRSGFGAVLFVGTGIDRPPAGAASWAGLAELAADGVEIGSALVSDVVPSLLPAPQLFEDAVASRVMLEALTGRPVTAVAPLLGVSDARIEGVLEGAGYTRLFRADGGTAPVLGTEMRLPRIAIRTDMTDAEYALALGVADEPFNDGDAQ
jgi:SAM-dependent methyltransferase